MESSVVVISDVDEGFAMFSEQAELRISGGYVFSGPGVLSEVLEVGICFSLWNPSLEVVFACVVVWVCVMV